MSEEDVRDGLRDAVVGEPPLVFDPDDLVTAARHQVTRRRALVAVGTATVAVAVAAVAIPVVLGRGPTQRAADQPTPTTATTTTPTTTSPTQAQIQWPPPGVEPVQYTEDQLRTRGEQMATHLRQTVQAVLPAGATFEVSEFGGEATGEYYVDQPHVNATITYTVGGERYSLFVTVWIPGAANDLFDLVCAGSDSDCEQVGEKDGGPLVAATSDVSGGVGGGATISTVYHFRKNGGVVQIAAYNYDMGGAAKVMPTIPMTLEQQKTLATDPELAL